MDEGKKETPNKPDFSEKWMQNSAIWCK